MTQQSGIQTLNPSRRPDLTLHPTTQTHYKKSNYTTTLQNKSNYTTTHWAETNPTLSNQGERLPGLCRSGVQQTNQESGFETLPQPMRETHHPLYMVSNVLTTSEPLVPTAEILPRAAKWPYSPLRPLRVHLKPSPTVVEPRDSRSGELDGFYPSVYPHSLPIDFTHGCFPAEVTRRKLPTDVSPE